LLRER